MKTKHYSQVKFYKGKPAFIIDLKPQSPYIYALTDRFKGSMTWEYDDESLSFSNIKVPGTVILKSPFWRESVFKKRSGIWK